VDQLAKAFSRLRPGQPLQVSDVLFGNINTIIKVDVAGRCYALRVRTQERVYRYEPDLMKEVFVAWLLEHGQEGPCDAKAAAAFTEIRAGRCGTVAARAGMFPVVRYYNWSRQRLPYPYCIYDWVDGEPLWNLPKPRLYTLAGQTLARVHRVQFSAFYGDFLSVGTRPIGWHQRFRAALGKETDGARSRLSRTLNLALARLEIPSAVSCRPCLVHNDFAPGNILVRDETIAAVIDWDNAVIDAPHLDFVKMKYWTAKSATGELTPDLVLFAAFVDGYGTVGHEIIASPLFAFYEILWLLRVFNFERSKEEQGIERTPGYPTAAVYEELLVEVLKRFN
jgi:aminoglycoside phosphotransferase (APT) family kinase protein